MAGGPDRGWSWVVAVACCYIHFTLFGLFRSCGVIYVALLQTFGVTREEAAWPFGIYSAVFSLVGPVAGLLAKYLAVRTIALGGSAIATAGVTLCYFADNVLWITIFLGVVHGLGFGLVMTFVPVTVNQYFVRHRATATGIAFSGGTMGSLIFPPVMEFLLDKYGLRGSFLIVGGLTMNTLVASSLLRTPGWLDTNDTLQSVTDKVGNGSAPHPEDSWARSRVAMMTSIRNMFDVLFHPMFIIITVTILSFFMLLHTFFIVVVDFAIDQGVSERSAIYVLTAFSFADLAGRLGSGWVTDKGLISRKILTVVNMISIGLLVQLYPFSKTYATLLGVSVCYGLLVGSVVIILYVHLADYLGLTVLPIAVGYTYFFSGVLNFVRPVMIGFFRDHMGSYNLIFHLLGALSMVAGLLWLLEPHVRGMKFSSVLKAGENPIPST